MIGFSGFLTSGIYESTESCIEFYPQFHDVVAALCLHVCKLFQTNGISKK